MKRDTTDALSPPRLDGWRFWSVELASRLANWIQLELDQSDGGPEECCKPDS